MSIKTIILDFDGTLADCKELHQVAFRDAVKKLCPYAEYKDEDIEGRPTREKIRILHTMGFEFNGDKLNEIKQAQTQDCLEEYVKYNEELYNEILRLSKRYKLCLASNATDVFVHRSLKIMKIDDLFLRINTATDFPAKPDIITFLDCMRYTGSAPGTTVIFEDSPVGVQGALSTGAEVVQVKDVADTIIQMRRF